MYVLYCVRLAPALAPPTSVVAPPTSVDAPPTRALTPPTPAVAPPTVLPSPVSKHAAVDIENSVSMERLKQASPAAAPVRSVTLQFNFDRCFSTGP